mmetsp:Transcript_19298/g.31590  ORF Transcript_19298/g.31590 Transcript_19298/m.31590 type:complete len:355 (+) Transcript_19298:1159-2223(+)
MLLLLISLCDPPLEERQSPAPSLLLQSPAPVSLLDSLLLSSTGGGALVSLCERQSVPVSLLLQSPAPPPAAPVSFRQSSFRPSLGVSSLLRQSSLRTGDAVLALLTCAAPDDIQSCTVVSPRDLRQSPPSSPEGEISGFLLSSTSRAATFPSRSDSGAACGMDSSPGRGEEDAVGDLAGRSSEVGLGFSSTVSVVVRLALASASIALRPDRAAGRSGCAAAEGEGEGEETSPFFFFGGSVPKAGKSSGLTTSSEGLWSLRLALQGAGFGFGCSSTGFGSSGGGVAAACSSCFLPHAGLKTFTSAAAPLIASAGTPVFSPPFPRTRSFFPCDGAGAGASPAVSTTAIAAACATAR